MGKGKEWGRVYRRGRTMCLTKVIQQRRNVFHWLRATRSQSGGPQTIAPCATLKAILCNKAGDRAREGVSGMWEAGLVQVHKDIF